MQMIWHANVEGNLVCVDFNIRVLKYSSTLYIIDRRSVSDLDRGDRFSLFCFYYFHTTCDKSMGFILKLCLRSVMETRRPTWIGK